MTRSFDYHTPADQWPTFAAWCSEQRNFGRHDRDNTEIDSWIVVPYTYTPAVSTLLEDSNHEVIEATLSEVDPNGEDHEMRYHSHWATGYKMLIVRPDSAALAAMVTCIAALADYPVLDEQDFSNREYAQQHADIADGLSALEVYQDGEELDTDDPIATDAPSADKECMLVHQIWAHMWNDGQPWRCLEETGQEGGGGVDRDDVERALSEMGYTETEHCVWTATTTDNHEDCESCPECGADG